MKNVSPDPSLNLSGALLFLGKVGKLTSSFSCISISFSLNKSKLSSLRICSKVLHVRLATLGIYGSEFRVLLKLCVCML